MDQSLYEAHEQLEASHWWFVGRRAVVRRVLQAHAPETRPLRLLDVGAGTGGMLELLSEFGEVTAVEASDDALERARRRFPGHRVLKGALPGPLPDETFDVVTAFDVLEHLDDPVEAVRALRARLAPQGRLVCTVPANPLLWSEHDELNHHRRRYTRALLRQHLESGGLRVEWMNHFNTLLFPAAFGVRMLHKALRRRSGEADLKPTAEPLNGLLTRLFASEAHLVDRAPLPFGVSLAAVAAAA